MAELHRFTVQAYVRGDHELVERIMAFLAQAIVAEDEQAQNAVAISFVEDGVIYDHEPLPFTEAQFLEYVNSWPKSHEVAELRNVLEAAVGASADQVEKDRSLWNFDLADSEDPLEGPVRVLVGIRPVQPGKDLILLL